MTFNEYQEQAILTEAPITPMVKARYFECSRIIVDLLEGSEGIELADMVKKYIFYGKGCDTLYKYLEDTRNNPFDLPEDDSYIRMVHGWLGIASEVPELAQAILNNDRVNVVEETFDSTWYTAVISDAAKVKMGDGASANIAKLKIRYPEKFTEYHANNRNLDTEREILSEGLSGLK